jgi:hypothetical protein
MKARFAFVLLAATFIMLGTALAAEGDRVDARFEIYGFYLGLDRPALFRFG